MNDTYRQSSPRGRPADSESARRCLRLFERNWMQRAKFRQMNGLLGSLEGKRCLDIGGLGGGISYQLRRLGGDWTSSDFEARAAERIRTVVGDPVVVATPGELPFANGQFDRVVVSDRLERVGDASAFIEECHRVLKPSGQLLILTPHAKPVGLLYPLQRLLGLTPRRDDPGRRRGYTHAQLFEVLKDGFDMHELKTFSRFGVGLVDALIRWMAGLVGTGEAFEADMDEQDFRRIYGLHKAMYPFSALAAGLDFLLFFTRGYHLVALAQRRLWKPRISPRLRDGRSIADAAINTRIGSAAPF